MEQNQVHTDLVAGAGGGKRKKRFLIAGLVLLLIVVAGGAGVGGRLLQQQMESKREAKPEVVAQTANDAQNEIFAGNYDEAREKIDDVLTNPNLSAESKQLLYMQQAAAYQSQKNYEAAMESYRKAEAQKLNLQVAQAIAELAVFMDNKQLAIEYYKKAITLIPEGDPMRDEGKLYFENWITTLENGGPIDESI